MYTNLTQLAPAETDALRTIIVALGRPLVDAPPTAILPRSATMPASELRHGR